jgi:hypothetical protein
MSLDLVIALAGVVVTILVVAGMVLLTPRGIDPAPRRVSPDAADDPTWRAPAHEQGNPA